MRNNILAQLTGNVASSVISESTIVATGFAHDECV